MLRKLFAFLLCAFVLLVPGGAKGCESDLDNGILQQILINNKCYPIECAGARWILDGEGKKAKCKEQSCKIDNGTGKWVNKSADKKTWECKLVSCNNGYNKSADEKECLKDCLPNLDKGIEKQKLIDGKCIPVQCVEERWMLNGKEEVGDKCEEQPCKFDNGKGEWVKEGDKWVCKLKECKNGYKENEDRTACIEMLKKCTPEQEKKHPNATKTGIKKGTEDCVALECKCGFELKNEQCVAWAENKECSADTKPKLPNNAATAKMVCEKDKAVCKIDECVSDDYELKDNKCESKNKQPCTPEDKNATAGEYKKRDGKLVCVISACKTNYSVDKDKNKCVAGMILSEEDQKAREKELEENAQKMRDKEQSMENKLLGAAGMGMTGAGLSQAMSAGAEQSADQAAELDMAAYLATMHCSYAPGKNVKGGEMSVELPGASALMPLYTEYVALANDLKIRKEALGMQPGIESEPILDGATSGLYDDVALGKTGGAYVSLARALSDPNGEDAKKWAAQKEETAKNKKTGTTMALTGAIGSAIANIAINSGDDKKEKSDEINAKYDLMERELNQLERGVNRNVPVVQACPSGTTGDGVPNCVCNDTSKDYKADTNSCQARIEDVSPQGIVSDKIAESNDPEKITPVVLGGSAVFETGSSKLRSEAESQLNDFVDSLKGYKKCSINVIGYTDPVGAIKSNEKLSQQRADAVKKYLESVAPSGLSLTVVAEGEGEKDCYCGLGAGVSATQSKTADYIACDGKSEETVLSNNERYTPCRRIEMSAECQKETNDVTSENVGELVTGGATVLSTDAGSENNITDQLNFVDLASTGGNYKSLDWCRDNGYMADYLKYIGYGLYTDDNAVIKNYEKWCKAQNGRLWAELGTWFPPFMPFPSYFEAD